jgi:hypothetical protein
MAASVSLRPKKKPAANCCGLVCLRSVHLFDDRVAFQVSVGFRELFQFRLVVDVWFGDLEGTRSFAGVGDDLNHTVNLFQIASDRGGAPASRHVGDCEVDDCPGGRRRLLTPDNGAQQARCRTNNQ